MQTAISASKTTDLARLLRDAELTQSDLARIIRVHPTTVSRWATERCELPGAVEAYLELRIQVIQALDRSDMRGAF